MSHDDLPGGAARVATEYPDVWDAYGRLGKAAAEAGPLEGHTLRLVKLALAIGARSEGATHSHVRRALDEGIGQEALMQVAVLAIPTLGLPGAVAAMTWIDDLFEPEPAALDD